MKKIWIFIFSLSISIQTLGQKENNVWTFSKNLGLDFNSGAPVIISTKIESVESCASVCDSSGNLLFYSDGLKIYDRLHNVMPNGGDLKGAAFKSATQGVAISPIPNEPGRYFIFTLDQIEPPGGTGELRYSLVDMTLNVGKGDVVPGFKNKLLGKDMSEKMVLAAACNKFWLITHDQFTPTFFAWPISSSSSTPVPVSSITPGLSGARYVMGEMKMSKDFRHLYMVNMNGYLERFSFNLRTGHFGDYLNIDSTNNVYGIEISASNKMVYVGDLRGDIYQYNLTLLPNVSLVKASKNKIANGIGLRRGPDDKIYVNQSNPGEISRINNPEYYGAACNFEINVPSLSHTSKFGYLQFGNSSVPVKGGVDEIIFTKIDTILCRGKSAIFSKDEAFGEIRWSDGTISSKKEINNIGTYWRHYTKGCIGYSDTITVKGLRNADTITQKALDTVVCFRTSLAVQSKISSDKYIWSDGGTDSISIFRNNDTRLVSALNKNKYCEYNIDTYSVMFTNFKIPLKDTFLCFGEKATLEASTTSAIAYLWSNGSTDSAIQVTDEGKYWVSVTVGACSKTDTAMVKSNAFELDLGGVQNVCKDSRVLIDPKVVDATFIWQDGSNSSTYYATDSGRYSVIVTKNGCTEIANLDVRYLDCVDCLRIPNAFTPNKDGVNDFFRVISLCPAKQYELHIVNRYGTVIFSTREITKGWDGTINGNNQEMGVYYYFIRAIFDRGLHNKEELFKGDITLIR